MRDWTEGGGVSIDGKRVFLAGATGLVGTHVLTHILEHHPTARIRAGHGRHTPPFIQDERIEYAAVDLTSAEACRQAVRGCDCAVMAAHANAGGAGVELAEPWRQVTDNVVLNTRLLEALGLERVRRVVCLGSITLYQEFDGHIRESDLDLNQDPHPAYFGIGWTVRFVEKLCRFWHERAGIDIALVRSANVYGPYARFDPRSANVIPAIIRKAADRMEPFEVWGSPDVTRDVVYAGDLARAVVMMLNREDIRFDVFNIGSGVRTTVGEVVAWALQCAAHSPREIVYRADRPVTNRLRALDCSKAGSLLGWRPEVTVEEGIRRTTDWWIANKNWWRK